MDMIISYMNISYLVVATAIFVDLVQNDDQSHYEGIIHMRIHSHREGIFVQQNALNGMLLMHLSNNGVGIPKIDGASSLQPATFHLEIAG